MLRSSCEDASWRPGSCRRDPWGDSAVRMIGVHRDGAHQAKVDMRAEGEERGH